MLLMLIFLKQNNQRGVFPGGCLSNMTTLNQVLLNPRWLVTLLASEQQRTTALSSLSAVQPPLMFAHRAHNAGSRVSAQQRRGQSLNGAILKSWD